MVPADARTDPKLFMCFWSKVLLGDGCWEWQAARFISGYGHFRAMGYAHRIAYEFLVGPIPPGLQIDHLCRNRSCVNPAHMEPVTQTENVRRGLAGAKNRAKACCSNDHPFDEPNTYWYPSGSKRACRTCQTESMRRWRANHPMDSEAKAQHARDERERRSRYRRAVPSL